MNNARLAAGDLLVTILDEKRTLDEALANCKAYSALQGPDRGFARAMASITLRQLGRIDSGLAPFLERPLDTAPPAARALLRLGAAQSWCLGTPDHAVVGETVAAAKLWPRARKASGFINAVLRKVVKDRAAFDASPVEAIWPDWLFAKFAEDLGAEATKHLARAQTHIPRLHLTVKDPARLTHFAETLEAEPFGHRSLILPAGMTGVETLDGYNEGDWWVQDVAASLPAQLIRAGIGARIVDMCAAPGGKTLQLASSGAHVFAVDRSKARLKRLSENLRRTQLEARIETICADGTSWTPPDGPVDAVLLDAPCSAFGTLRRHPEGAWIKSPQDIARFSDIQTRLLKASLTMLKPGGELVYCVCSPLFNEGIKIIESALLQGGLKRAPITSPEVPGFAQCLTENGDLLTLPGGSTAHDAFYIARLARI